MCRRLLILVRRHFAKKNDDITSRDIVWWVTIRLFVRDWPVGTGCTIFCCLFLCVCARCAWYKRNALFSDAYILSYSNSATALRTSGASLLRRVSQIVVSDRAYHCYRSVVA